VREAKRRKRERIIIVITVVLIAVCDLSGEPRLPRRDDPSSGLQQCPGIRADQYQHHLDHPAHISDRPESGETDI